MKSKALICLMAAWSAAIAKPPPTAQVAATEMVDEVEPIIYIPSEDAAALVKQPLIDALEANVWGASLGSDVWNLDLDFASHTSNFATGRNRQGLPFEVTFAERYVTTLDDGTVYGVWLGKVSSVGDFYTYGVYLEINHQATLVPLYSRVDQTEMQQVYDATVESYSPRQYACVLDAVGTFQQRLNGIMMHTCLHDHLDRSYAQIAICTAAGVPACWITAGLACVPGAACLASVGINDFFWQRSWSNQISQNMNCLCTDSLMRAQYPNIETPTSDCSKFECPPNPLLLVPKL